VPASWRPASWWPPELRWLFREQETCDVGIDAHLEVVTDDSSAARTTGLLALQIKSGESQFTAVAEDGWWYPCDAAHVAYWRHHSWRTVAAYELVTRSC
jgi:hypothetical protein